VHGDQPPRAEGEARLDGLLGVEVVREHHRFGLVSADRHRREIEGAEDAADVGKPRGPAAVAHEVEAPVGRQHDPRAPQRAPRIEQAALAPVLRGNTGDLDSAHPRAPSPVELLHPFDARAAEQRGIAERHQEARVATALRDASERRQIEVVVVGVRDQDEVDGRERVQLETRFDPAARPEPRDGARGGRPDRVGQEADPAELDQQRGVTDPGRGGNAVPGVFAQKSPVVGDALRRARPACDRARDAAEPERQRDPRPGARDLARQVQETAARVAGGGPEGGGPLRQGRSRGGQDGRRQPPGPARPPDLPHRPSLAGPGAAGGRPYAESG